MAIINLDQKIKLARQSGYSDEQIKNFLSAKGENEQTISQALATTPSAPTQTEAPVVERMASSIQQAGKNVQEAIIGQGQFQGENPIMRGFQATAEAAKGTVDTASQVLPQPVRSGLESVGNAIGGAVKWLSEKIGSSQLAQDFVTKHPQAAADLETIAKYGKAEGDIAGSILAVEGVRAPTTATAEAIVKIPNIVGNSIESASNIAGKSLSQAKSWVQQPIKANVETVLKETPRATFDTYENLAREATKNNKNTTPLEFVGSRAQEGLDQIQTKLSAIGKQKADVMNIGGAGLTVLDKKLLTATNQSLQSLKNSRSLVEGDSRLLDDVIARVKQLEKQPTVTANDVDRLVDYAQDKLYTSGRDLTIPVTDATTAQLRSVISELNTALKSKLPERYAQLNDRYSTLINIRNELNAKLGAGGEKGGALMKRVFSPSDANTKKLFAQVLDETGIDLVNEATLARFMMDTLGDARQKSMLEQLNLSVSKPTAGSVATRFIDYVVEKANSPEQILARARALTSD